MELDVRIETEQRKSCGCSSKEEQAGNSCCSEKPADSNRREGKGPDRRLDRIERRMEPGPAARNPAEESGYTGTDRAERMKIVEPASNVAAVQGRRRSDDRKSAEEEGEMSEYQFEFVMAIQTSKKVNKKMYPTWTEILEIVNQLGYRKVLPRKIRLDMPESPLTEV